MPRLIGTNISSRDIPLGRIILKRGPFDEHVGSEEMRGFKALLDAMQASGLLSSFKVLDDSDADLPAIASYSRLFKVTAPAAASVSAVHASYGYSEVLVFPGPITNPALPRNVTADFGLGWAGGNVVLVGTDQFDRAQTETLLANAGAQRVGTKIWKTITGISHTIKSPISHSGVTVGTGNKLGLDQVIKSSFCLLTVDDAGVFTGEAATLDLTTNSFTPTTVSDGSNNYYLEANV